MVKRSLQFINEPYVLMGNVHLTSTTKFSVKGIQDSTYSSVHITFEYVKCVVTCTNGMCSVHMHNKKKIPKFVKVENAKGFAPMYRQFLFTSALSNHTFLNTSHQIFKCHLRTI